MSTNMSTSLEKLLYKTYPFLTEKAKEVEEAIAGITNQISSGSKYVFVRSFGSLQGETDAVKSIAYSRLKKDDTSKLLAMRALCTHVAWETFRNGSLPNDQTRCFDDYLYCEHNIKCLEKYIKDNVKEDTVNKDN